MAKVHPKPPMICSSSSYLSFGRAYFTLWMKSLVIHGNGCTVFNSEGELVFRVDNYQTRLSSEIFLMDVNGKVLFSIKRKKLTIYTNLDIYTWTCPKFQKEGDQRFKVKRKCSVLGGDDNSIHVTQKCHKGSCYKIKGLKGKSTLNIEDYAGRILAEIKPKQSLGGMSLGDDVMNLTIKANVDQSLVMALVIAHQMIYNRL